MRELRLGLAQVNATVGDLDGNFQKILDYIARARELSVDVLAFPEMVITGYMPEDLLLLSHVVSIAIVVEKEEVGHIQKVQHLVYFVSEVLGESSATSGAPLHTREVAGSIPAAPMTEGLQTKGFFFL